jgi:hypothetical protein
VVLKSELDDQPAASNDYPEIMDNLEGLLLSIINNDDNRLRDIFPDSKFRNRALRKIEKILPKADEQWQLGFSRTNSNKEFTLSNNELDRINDLLSKDVPTNETLTVTGELIRIDFDKRLVVLRYPPTHQEIECIYLEEIEDSMIENRRQMIQVTGQFTLNADGHPIKLTDVTRIEPLDLSPISLREISGGDKKLRLKTPLLLTPKMDEETKQLLVIEDDRIGLDVFAYTRDELVHDINEQLLMMWDEYANTSIDKLALDARLLREKLLESLEEVQNATVKG